MLGGTSGTFSDSDSDEGGLRSGEITPSHNQAEAMSPDTLSGSGFERRQNSVMSADALSESSRGQVDIMSTGTLSGSGCEPRKNDVMSTDAISESCGGHVDIACMDALSSLGSNYPNIHRTLLNSKSPFELEMENKIRGHGGLEKSPAPKSNCKDRTPISLNKMAAGGCKRHERVS